MVAPGFETKSPRSKLGKASLKFIGKKLVRALYVAPVANNVTRVPVTLMANSAKPATPCSNSSAWRSGVILGNGQMAPVKPAPSAAVCCSRCAALSGCGC